MPVDWDFDFGAMQIGDSGYMPANARNSSKSQVLLTSRFAGWKKRTGSKFKIKTQTDKENGGCWFWRKS